MINFLTRIFFSLLAISLLSRYLCFPCYSNNTRQLPDPTPVTAAANPQTNQIVLEVGPNDYYAVNKEVVPKDRLPARLKEIYEPRPDKIIFVKGDPKVQYQDVIWAMDVARGAGVKVIGVPPKDDAASN